MPVARPRPTRSLSPTVLLTFVMAAGLVAILVYLAGPAFASKVYAYNDLAREAIPMRHFFARCLAQGERPYWWPNISCGFYLHGETMVGMCHPWHILLYRSLPVVAAFNVEFLANYALMLVGMTLLLLRWRLRPPAALLGAGLYTFLGFNMLHFMHISIEPACAHIPFLVLAVDGLMRAASGRAAALWALALAALVMSNVLVGQPQIIFMGGLTATGYAALLTPRVDRGARRLAVVLAAHAIGMVGGAAQLLPTYRLMKASQLESVTRDYHAAGSIHPLNWVVTPLAPYLYWSGIVSFPERPSSGSNPYDEYGNAYNRDDLRSWEMGVYGGAVLPALLTWLAMRRRRLGRHYPLAVISAALAIFGMVLSVGKFLPVFELTRRLPGFGFFRLPGRYVLIAQFALATLAAVAFNDLWRVTRRRAARGARWPRPLFIVALLALLVPVGIRTVAHLYPEVMSPSVLAPRRYDLVDISLVGGAAGLVALAARGRRPAVAGLALLALADMAWFARENLKRCPWQDIDTIAWTCDPEFKPPRGFVGKSASGQDVRLSYSGRFQEDDRPTIRGIRFNEEYASFRPKRRLDYDKTPALRVAGVGWVKRHHPEMVNGEPVNLYDWGPVPDPLPRARLVSRARISSDPRADLPTIDPATTALVDEPLDLPDAPPGMARIASDRPGAIAVDTQAPSRQLLVVSESYFDGWTVRVDGGPPRPAIRAYGDFLGCAVEAGAHRVEFAFDPLHLRIGIGITAVVAALVGVGMVILLVRGPRPPTRGPEEDEVDPYRSGDDARFPPRADAPAPWTFSAIDAAKVFAGPSARDTNLSSQALMFGRNDPSRDPACSTIHVAAS